MNTDYVDVYLWARDADHAIELAGHGDSEEFESEAAAKEAYDPETHQGWRLFHLQASVMP